MAKLVNKTNRAIAVDGLMLVPGKAQQVKDVKKLTAKYPRLAELFETGDIVEAESKTVDTKVTEEKKSEETEEEVSRPIGRRKRG